MAPPQRRSMALPASTLSDLETPIRLRQEARGENFPVASRLLARTVRPHVIAFYNFVRAADEIADAPGLSPEVRLRALDAMATGLADPGPATPPEARALVASIAGTGVGREEAEAMLQAFRQDAVKQRYAEPGELLAYCRHSADPVGRFLLRLHGEDEALFPASDALCTALQLLNHAQDIGPDRARLDRVYLPQYWLAAEGAGVADLDRPSCSPGLRRVLDRLLEEVVAPRLDEARGLRGLRDRRLRMEAGAVLALAGALARRLAHEDPLAGRVALGRGRKLLVGLAGALGSMR
jgi:hydroxysqualene synthase